MRRLYGEASALGWDQPCYGIAYYFVKGYHPSRDADANPAAKRLWDALEGIAYADDAVLRLRIAGIVELGPASDGAIHAEELDLTALVPASAERLLQLFQSNTRQFLYVEIGAARPAMFAFNLAGEGRTA